MARTARQVADKWLGVFQDLSRQGKQLKPVQKAEFFNNLCVLAGDDEEASEVPDSSSSSSSAAPSSSSPASLLGSVTRGMQSTSSGEDK